MSFIIQHAQTTTHQHVQRRNQSKDNTTNQREPTTHEQDTKTQAKKPVNHAALKIGYQPRNRLISQQQTTHHTQNTQKKMPTNNEAQSPDTINLQKPKKKLESESKSTIFGDRDEEDTRLADPVRCLWSPKVGRLVSYLCPHTDCCDHTGSPCCQSKAARTQQYAAV